MPQLINGLDVTVEVNKSKFKFSKCKHNKGHLVKGQWAIGRVCHETKEVYPDNKQDAQTLLDTYKKTVSS